MAAELLALAYIAIVAEVAIATGAFYILFPELGALSHDIFTRPRGSWASAPVLLVVTPVLTALLGTLITRSLPYGYLSVMLAVVGALAIVLALRSPIAPRFLPACCRSRLVSGVGGIRRESFSELFSWLCYRSSGSGSTSSFLRTPSMPAKTRTRCLAPSHTGACSRSWPWFWLPCLSSS